VTAYQILKATFRSRLSLGLAQRWGKIGHGRSCDIFHDQDRYSKARTTGWRAVTV